MYTEVCNLYDENSSYMFGGGGVVYDENLPCYVRKWGVYLTKNPSIMYGYAVCVAKCFLS